MWLKSRFSTLPPETPMHLLSSVAPGCTNAITSLSTPQCNDEPVRKDGCIIKFNKFFAPTFMAAVLTLTPISTPPVSIAQTINVQKGLALFRQSCIGCHDAGGNIIQPGATLFLKDLLRNGVDTEEEIYKVTYFGKARMPGFGENCTPRGQCTFGARLSEDEIKLLADFVKLQADQGWPTIETNDGE